MVNFALNQNKVSTNQPSVTLTSAQKTATLNTKPSRSNLRKIKKILEPNKPRQLTKLSKIKRSGSFVWQPKVKPDVNNLYTDPTSINLLSRLRNNLASTSTLSQANHLSS